MKKPLVSVAIITYNQEAFISECLESTLSQDYPSMQIVVGDDASTDNTPDIILGFQRKHPNRIAPILNRQNLGITGNCNSVFSKCAGKYIAWLGGDDLMLPGKISTQVDFMEANSQCAVSYHDLDVFDSLSGKSLYRFNKANKPRSGGIKTAIKHGVFNGASSSMYRKDDCPKIGFDQRIPVASDWLHTIDSLSGGNSILFINRILGRYRRHVNNTTKPNSHCLSQAQIDHLVTCQILLQKYPHFSGEILHRYSRIIFSYRANINYLPAVRFSAFASLHPRSIAYLMSYFFTGTKQKI